MCVLCTWVITPSKLSMERARKYMHEYTHTPTHNLYCYIVGLIYLPTYLPTNLFMSETMSSHRYFQFQSNTTGSFLISLGIRDFHL